MNHLLDARLSFHSSLPRSHPNPSIQPDGSEKTGILSLADLHPVMSHPSEYENTPAEVPQMMRLVDSGRRFRYDPTMGGTAMDFLELPPAYTED